MKPGLLTLPTLFSADLSFLSDLKKKIHHLNLPNAIITCCASFPPILTPFCDMLKPLGCKLNYREEREHLRAIFHSTLHEVVTVEAFKY